MKLNPEYKRYQDAQSGGVPSTTVARPDAALPVVSSMEDYAQFNNDMGIETPLAESTNATIEMMQEPEIYLAAGSKYLVVCYVKVEEASFFCNKGKAYSMYILNHFLVRLTISYISIVFFQRLQ